jgi:Adenylate and Guanylate cyclase catalytic domain
MFTDLVGFSALVQEDEALALRTVEDTSNLLRPVIVAYGGREVKALGDGFLVEFDSALDATECAIVLPMCPRPIKPIFVPSLASSRLDIAPPYLERDQTGESVGPDS